MVGAMMLAGGAMMLMAVEPAPATATRLDGVIETLTVRELVLVDAQGRQRGVLTVMDGRDGDTAMLRLCSPSAVAYTTLAHSAPLSGLYCESGRGKERAWFGISEEDGPDSKLVHSGGKSLWWAPPVDALKGNWRMP